MKSATFLLLASLIFTMQVSAQSVAINTDGSAANTSAILDIKSTAKGLLIPRMTTIQRTAIATPAKGLIVFDITTNGLWVHNGTVWNALSSGSSPNYWTATGSDIYNNNAGNIGIGTITPTNRLQIGTFASSSITGNDIAIGNGTQAMSFYQSATNSGWYTTNNFALMPGVGGTGNLGIGTTTPATKLTIHTPNNADGFSHESDGGIILKESVGGISAAFGTSSAHTFRLVANGNAVINIDPGGFVGVGVSDPLYIYKMDIADRIRIRSSSASSTAGIALNNSNNSVISAFIGTKDLDLVGIYGSVSGWGLLMNTNTGALGIGYQNPVAGYRLSVQGNQYVNGLIATTGNAEIGADALVAGKLTVNGYLPYTYTGVSYGMDNTGTGIAFGTYNVSIEAAQGMKAQYFICNSDARIKNIIGVSNSAKDLEIINAIQITDYTMKDKIMFGNKPFKKVIAQEVEKIYPQAISKSVGYIPNVYAVATGIEKTTNGYLLSFKAAHNLTKTAKKIQVMLESDTKQFDIISIPSDTQVEIKAADLKSDKVFVYGEQVNDFRAVDYEGLTTLNISATQELSKLISEQNKKIKALEEAISRLTGTTTAATDVKL